MSNRSKIITTAINLFNQQGTKAISTNHIAEAASISPGNLYYHFKDKESIIREIHRRMIADWDILWQSGAPQHTLHDLVQVIRHNFILEWRYRFFYRELRSILQRDKELTHTYQTHVRGRLNEQETFFKGYMQHGVLQQVNAVTLRKLLTTCWVLANHWIAHLEENGEPVGPEALLQGEGLILFVMTPYLTEEAKAQLPVIQAAEEHGRQAYAELLEQPKN